MLLHSLKSNINLYQKLRHRPLKNYPIIKAGFSMLIASQAAILIELFSMGLY